VDILRKFQFPHLQLIYLQFELHLDLTNSEPKKQKLFYTRETTAEGLLTEHVKKEDLSNCLIHTPPPNPMVLTNEIIVDVLWKLQLKQLVIKKKVTSVFSPKTKVNVEIKPGTLRQYPISTTSTAQELIQAIIKKEDPSYGLFYGSEEIKPTGNIILTLIYGPAKDENLRLTQVSRDKHITVKYKETSDLFVLTEELDVKGLLGMCVDKFSLDPKSGWDLLLGSLVITDEPKPLQEIIEENEGKSVFELEESIVF